MDIDPGFCMSYGPGNVQCPEMILVHVLESHLTVTRL